MKLSIIATVATLGAVSAFAPSGSVQRAPVAMNAEQQSRKNFLAGAAAAAFVLIPAVAGAMDQENVADPTEQWETGAPTAAAAAARRGRYENPRTQMTSNFAPIKRLTLERKSPVQRLDISGPDFKAYHDSLPGLYKAPPGK